MTAAAQHLRHAKGLDPMITASKSGLPIDITKVRNLLSRPNNTIHMRGERADAHVLNMLFSLVIARGDNARPKWKMKRWGEIITPLCATTSHPFCVCASLVRCVTSRLCFLSPPLIPYNYKNELNVLLNC